jgi:hypothetical protein
MLQARDGGNVVTSRELNSKHLHPVARCFFRTPGILLFKGFFLSEHLRPQEVGCASQGWLAAFPWLGPAPSARSEATPGRPRKPGRHVAQRAGASTLPPREVQMNTTTKVSLVTILASCLLATMAIGPAQAAMRHHQAASACAAQPGTLRAFFCPAPAAPAKSARQGVGRAG